MAGGSVGATGGLDSKTVPISPFSGAGGTGKARGPPGAEILKTESKRKRRTLSGSDKANRLLSEGIKLSTQRQCSLEDAERSGDETRLAEELRNAGPDVAPKVIGILERTRSPRVRNAAALALADMRAAGARDSLIEALRNAETRGHRGTILYALDELGANLPLSLLIDIIVHDPYEAREEALGFLTSGRIDRDANPLQVERKLRLALRRGDQERSHAVREALGYLSEHAPTP